MTCQHCFDEGDWPNADACPSCEISGHIPFEPCPECKAEYEARVKWQSARINARLARERAEI